MSTPPAAIVHRSALCAFAVLALATASVAAGAAPPIAYDRTVDGAGRVVLVAPGTGVTRVVTKDDGHESPLWSPDRRTLVYVGATVLSESALYSYTLATGRIRRLTRRPGVNAYPAWSPDGSRIAWTSGPGGALSIWTMASDGSRPRALTHGTTDTNPSWSPSGGTIAFVDAARGSLELVRPDGRERRRVRTPRLAVGASAPAWSPDGHQIAVTGADGALYVVTPDGNALRRLTRPGPAAVAWRPVWSPSGRTIAFIDIAGRPRLVLLDVASGRTRTLVRGTDGVSAPTWSPDGASLAFADEHGHLETIGRDGTGRRTITHGVTADADPVWR
jgi:TolB protein